VLLTVRPGVQKNSSSPTSPAFPRGAQLKPLPEQVAAPVDPEMDGRVSGLSCTLRPPERTIPDGDLAVKAGFGVCRRVCARHCSRSPPGCGVLSTVTPVVCYRKPPGGPTAATPAPSRLLVHVCRTFPAPVIVHAPSPWPQHFRRVNVRAGSPKPRASAPFEATMWTERPSRFFVRAHGRRTFPAPARRKSERIRRMSEPVRRRSEPLHQSLNVQAQVLSLAAVLLSAPGGCLNPRENP